MITPVDIQLSIQGSGQRIDVTPLATELIANLLNDFIYEYKDRELKAILDRHHRALEFVFNELRGDSGECFWKVANRASDVCNRRSSSDRSQVARCAEGAGAGFCFR